MAKYEKRLTGDFDSFLHILHDGVMDRSMSAVLQGYSNHVTNGVKCAVRVYERHSWPSGNRVSMNITATCHGEDIFVSVITAAGSGAVFLKLNTFGEKAFLQHAIDIIENF
ncbi:MAG: DUF6054 family protein [Defluviitaleaceae bacterium]|nr:DUF6054 family protein [Defluviitaleaceae bacterium]